MFELWRQRRAVWVRKVSGWGSGDAMTAVWSADSAKEGKCGQSDQHVQGRVLARAFGNLGPRAAATPTIIVSPSRCSLRFDIHIAIAHACFCCTQPSFRHDARTESADAGSMRGIWSLQGCPAAWRRNPRPRIGGEEPRTPVWPPAAGPLSTHHRYVASLLRRRLLQ